MQTTFPQLLLRHAAERPDAPAMREKEYGIWQAHSWAGMAVLVEHIACGLHSRGLQRGEHMVLIGANRPRLYATMLAVQALGAIPIALHQDAVGAECVFPITNAAVRFAFAEDQEQVDKLLEIRVSCPDLCNIVFDEPRGLYNYNEPGLGSLNRLIEAGKAFTSSQPAWFKSEVEKVKPGDVAAMFFTSGTTGNPKGVVHTHNTLLDRARAGAEFDKLTSSEEVLAYLPPAWIGQNIFSYAQWLSCGYVVNCPESASTVMIDLKEVGPIYCFAPPRVRAIGSALMANPSMVLLDEPSMGLAPQIVEEVFEIMKDLNKREKVTFLLAEQNTSMALKYSDYGYIMESGRVVMDGIASDLASNEDVKEFYLGMGGGERKSFKDAKSYKRRKRWLA